MTTTERLLRLGSSDLSDSDLLKVWNQRYGGDAAVTLAKIAEFFGTSITEVASQYAELSQKWANEDEDTVVADGEYSAKHYAAKAAEALDDFTDLYLGAKSSDPTLDNDGDALQDGALYFNTTDNKMRAYDLSGTAWVDYEADAVAAKDAAETAAQAASDDADDAEAARIASEAAQTGAETARAVALASLNASGHYSAATLAQAISDAEGALSVGDSYFATGTGLGYTNLYVIETGPVSTFLRSYLDNEVSQAGRLDVLLAEVDSAGKALNILRSDGRYEHSHKVGSIGTDELVDADKLNSAPEAITHDRDDLPFVQTDSADKLLIGVDQQGRIMGPDRAPLASQSFANIRSAPDIAVGHITRQRLLTVGAPITEDEDFPGDGVAGGWQALPYFAASHFDLFNETGVELELRRTTVKFDGMLYAGAWDPSGGDLPISGDQYRTKFTWFWHVTVTDGEFEAGDRVVFLGGVEGSTGFGATTQRFVYPDGSVSADAYSGVFFKVLRGEDMRFYRGTWNPASAAYPSDANLVDGDTYSVSAAGAYDGVTYAYGDYLVRSGTGWRKEVSPTITEVADTASAAFSVPSGYLSEWEVRRKTGAAPVYADIRVQVREPVTAQVQEISGRKQIWLHYADGSVNKLATVNAAGNAFSPSFDGSILSYKSDVSGEVLTYRMATEKMPGKFGRPFVPVKAKSDTFASFGDSYNSRWGSPLLRQIEYDDVLNGRQKNRNGLVPADVGSLDQYWIGGLANILAEGGYVADDYLSGIICYTLDWNNGRMEEREAILRVLAGLQGSCTRLLVAGNTAGRDIRWNGSAMQVHSSFVGDADKIEDEARLEEMMGGEFFEGGNYANMRKWSISARNPRFTASDWDPVLQMTIGDVADTYGFWGLWSLIDIQAANYPAMRSNINEANFQGYIDDQSEILSSTDWHYYVGTGVGDAGEGRTYYKLGGTTYSFGGGDGVHLPSATAAYGYAVSEMTVTGPDADTSNLMNLMAYDVATELSARGWLD